MSYLQRFAIHNTPAAQQYMRYLLEENKRLKEQLPKKPPPPFDFNQFCSINNLNTEHNVSVSSRPPKS